jgi:hypothetical protein
MDVLAGEHTATGPSPGVRPATIGQVPTTLEAVYAEVGLPMPALPTPAETRVTATNRRTITTFTRTRERPPTEPRGRRRFP